MTHKCVFVTLSNCRPAQHSAGITEAGVFGSQLSDHSNWCDAGDNRRTAHVVAAAAGIKHVMAEVLPAGKAEQVKDLA